MSVQLRDSLLLLALEESVAEDEGGAGRLVGPHPEGAIGRVVVHPPTTTVLGSVQSRHLFKIKAGIEIQFIITEQG